MRLAWWTGGALGLVVVGAALFAVVDVFESPLRVEAPKGETPELSADTSLRDAFESLGAPARAHVTPLPGNVEAWLERWRLVAGARERITTSTFILDDDVVGWAFLGLLRERARAGVHVRLLVDGVGTDVADDLRDGLAELATSGVEIRIARPLFERVVDAMTELDATSLVASEHDKILVVDDDESMVGGRNIAVPYVAEGEDLPTAFVDLDLSIVSADVADALEEAFRAQWHGDSAPIEPVDDSRMERRLEHARAAMDAWMRGEDVPGPGDFSDLRALRGAMTSTPTPKSFEARALVVDSPIRDDESPDPIFAKQAKLIAAAEETILVQSPYLILPEEGIEFLARASRRGIDVTILTNSPVSSDNWMSQVLFLEQWPRLLWRAPTVDLHVGGTRRVLHSKVMVFDGEFAAVGTYNLDPLSMSANSEVVVFLASAPLARALSVQARGIIEKGPPESYRYEIERLDDADGGVPPDEIPIAFGPEDHAPPEVLKDLESAQWVYETMLGRAEMLYEAAQTRRRGAPVAPKAREESAARPGRPF